MSIDGTEAGFELGESESGAGPDGSHQGGSHSHYSERSGHSGGGGSGPGGGGGNGSASAGPEMPSLSQSLHSAMHNPIDKLFMMQNSYFSSADHP